LSSGVDFQIVEGGSLTLTKPIVSGNELHALYVARISQPAGTSFSSNYAHEIAPTSGNGLLNQRLFSTYTLYGPDSFYFSVEKILSFLPQLAAEINSDIQSVTVTGPNIQDVQTISNATLGQPSLFYPEQHLENIDATIRELLKFYNDLINLYEDLLSNLDGRVVGGLSGRFRFDGKIDNPPVSDFSNLTNDIDDFIKIGNSITVTSFTPISIQQTEIYSPMWKPNPFSRLFPTSRLVTTFITDPSSAANGAPIGSFSIKNADGQEENIKNLTSANLLVLTRPRQKFSALSSGSIIINANGDVNNKIPAFIPTQIVTVYNPDGSINVNEAEIDTITASGSNIFIALKDPTTGNPVVPSTLRGSLTANPPILGNSSTIDEVWVIGGDYLVAAETGQILNFSITPFPTNPLVANRLYDGNVTFINQSADPFRIPVLDGQILDDSQRFPDKVIFRISEMNLIDDEIKSYNYVGSATVLASLNAIQNTASIPSVVVGDTIRFVDGPNAGFETVIQSISGAVFTISPNFSTADSQSRVYTIVSASFIPLDDVLDDELAILESNVVLAPAPGANIGQINSELKTIDSIIRNLGLILTSGTGSAAASTLTDATQDFVDLGVTSNSFLYVPSGANLGLYTIVSFTNISLTINGIFASPGTTSYVLINPYSFLGSSEFEFANEFLQKTRAFFDETSSWRAAATFSGITDRIGAIQSRQNDINSFIQTIESILGQTDKLYDGRFAWIRERVDMKTGTLVQKTLLQQQRQETQTKLVENQLKLLVMNSLITQTQI
jgi:hypothetical protein